ncbi:ABC transporter ATP-binding protein [Alicyclobacillus fastidiosus]|uniref:ABC transporter ATP-binding protein n=1 Tax=Alicyclobacillus fastidiosus TaxID=392011 RepID=A0ABY6ZEN2_9BACL|nr:ABC transporter ATP-binding protein [Alicyclobacillus fastidiosus]WAH41304.1 ABC transporter ATP-binding protein [Alicyclobacillus fastidiosus]GMA62906.1 dipeptide/oligopeptide/nickel ABC transporter ATP-binding protein [Alicyclobacillus fastidiosus]
METILDVQNLTIEFPTETRVVRAVKDVSFQIQKGESLGIVGESGSGKSTIAFGLFNSVPDPGRISGGKVHFFGGPNFLDIKGETRRKFYWSKISMVFQASQNTLNPLLRICKQVDDIAHAHRLAKNKARAKAFELFDMMHLDGNRVMNSFPHELSGGMKQRVSIGLALLLDPEIIVLDEPTTALDVISQASVLKILNRIRKEREISLIFITHDISVISEVVDSVMVMYAGRVVEQGPAKQVMRYPSHPYTRGLIRSIPPLVGEVDYTKALKGSPVNLNNIPSGCPFQSRCELRIPTCSEIEPPRVQLDNSVEVACHLAKMEATSQG